MVVSPTAQAQDDPLIAANRRGDVAVTWQQRTEREGFGWLYHVFCGLRPLGEPWEPAVQVSGTSGRIFHPDIDLDDWGRAYLLWADESQRQVFFDTRPAAGPWSGNVVVRDASTDTAAWGARMAVDRSGNAHAVWVDWRNDNGDIYGAYRPAGGPWSANVRVNDDATTARQADPEIMADAAGNAFAIWLDARGGVADIYGSTWYPGSGWTPNRLLIPSPSAAGSAASTQPLQAGGGEENADAGRESTALAPQGGNYYPRVFLEGTSGRGVSVNQVTDAMDPESPTANMIFDVGGSGADPNCDGAAPPAAAAEVAQGAGGNGCRNGAQGPPLNHDEAEAPPAEPANDDKVTYNKIEIDGQTYTNCLGKSHVCFA